MKLGVTAALVDGRFVPGDVEIADGRIAGFGVDSYLLGLRAIASAVGARGAAGG